MARRTRMRTSVDRRTSNPRAPENWRPTTRVLFSFDPWRGGFALSVEQRGHPGGHDEQNEDGSVRWRTVTGPDGTPVVCHAEHAPRSAGTTAYVLHASDAGFEVSRPLVRHVDGEIIARAKRLPEGDLVIV